VAGAKLILVVGHTRCGAVTAAVDLVGSLENAEQATGCQHLKPIISEIQQSLDPVAWKQLREAPAEAKAAFVDEVARRNVQHSLRQVVEQSQTIRRLIDEGRIAVVGAMYDVGTGKIDYLLDEAIGLQRPGSTPAPSANPNASNIV
jgi:carbonic anhydrase/SulP family sulfate permease